MGADKHTHDCVTANFGVRVCEFVQKYILIKNQIDIKRMVEVVNNGKHCL